MSNSFFITGTNTDIGKTWVSRLLCDAFVSLGKTGYFKPVQTGCEINEKGELRAPDFECILQGKTEQFADLSTHVPYRFKLAASPHLAAEQENRVIALEPILSAYKKLHDQCDYIIVEGAGGLLVPLTREIMQTKLIQLLGIPVILVTAPVLGTLNHTMLTIERCRDLGIPLAGLIINNVSNEEKTVVYKDNVSFLFQYSGDIPKLEVEYGYVNENAVISFCRKIL